MQKTVHIIGAGMAGLLAAQMLRRHYNVKVYERQKELPNNHSAVLRFRTPEVGNVLGIEFKKVQMVKTYIPEQSVVGDAISYSHKCTGRYSTDRSILAGTVIAERYVAPDNLIERMADGIEIEYGADYEGPDWEGPEATIISTIPMPVLMPLLEYPEFNVKDFNYISGYNVTASIRDCNCYCSILFPGSDVYSRVSITGNQLIIEIPDVYKDIDPHAYRLDLLSKKIGIAFSDIRDVQIRQQQYAKITEINEDERKNFIRFANKFNIYSLGRYATWRPKLLLDDLVHDVRRIQAWIDDERRYRD